MVLSQNGLLSERNIQFRQEAAVGVEDIAVSVIDRVEALRSLGAKLSYKKKAFSDVLKTLRSMGLHSVVAAPNVINSTTAAKQALQLMPLLYTHTPLEMALQCVDDAFCTNIAGKCEEYMVRVLAGVRKMRYRALASHKDLTAAEVQRAQGMLEHLWLLCVSHRRTVSEAAQQTSQLLQWTRFFEASKPLDDDQTTRSMHKRANAEMMWRHKDLVDRLLLMLHYYQTLYNSLQQGADAQNVLAACTAGTQSLISLFPVLQSVKTSIDQAMLSWFGGVIKPRKC